MAILTPEERKAKLQARMAALQEQMERVERGEPIGGGRGRAPNPMGDGEVLKSLTRQISALKEKTGVTYHVVAAIIKENLFDQTFTEDELAEMDASGAEILKDYPKSDRGRKAKVKEGAAE